MEFDMECMLLEEHVLNIEKLIALFNRDTVLVQDLSTYRMELENIFESFSTFERKFLDIRRSLDRKDQNDLNKLAELAKMHLEVRNKVVKNEVEVKRRLSELQ